MTKETYTITYPKKDGYTMAQVEALIGLNHLNEPYSEAEQEEGITAQTIELRRLVEQKDAIIAEIDFGGFYYDIDISLYSIMDNRDLDYTVVVHEE